MNPETITIYALKIVLKGYEACGIEGIEGFPLEGTVKIEFASLKCINIFSKEMYEEDLFATVKGQVEVDISGFTEDKEDNENHYKNVIQFRHEDRKRGTPASVRLILPFQLLMGIAEDGESLDSMSILFPNEVNRYYGCIRV